MSYAISLASIEEAAGRIAPYLHRTPVQTSRFIDRLASQGVPVSSDPGHLATPSSASASTSTSTSAVAGESAGSGGPSAALASNSTPRRVFFKCELFQKSGSFKARGACNATMKLDDSDAAKGLVTHSSGNHAQALAVAASLRGVPAYIVMPRNAPSSKQQAVRDYGAQVTLCDPTPEARETTAAKVVETTGGHLVHPSNDPDVMSGQGTIALELLEQVAELRRVPGRSPADRPVLDAVIVPIGGAGMTSGVTMAIKSIDPRIKVIAAEPLGADDAYRSKEAGRILPQRDDAEGTVADGLRTLLGSNTFPIVRDMVDRIIRVPDREIIACQRLIWERMKLLIEPSAGVGVAALLSDEFKGMEGLENVGVILCGGNMDLTSLPWVLDDGSTINAPRLA